MPPSGKSRFLRYAYAKALQCGVPVVYCDAVDRYWLSDERECIEFYLKSVPPPPYPTEGTLVLVDSGAYMKLPRSYSLIVLVEASSCVPRLGGLVRVARG